ncbi:MAG: 2-dehydro-3-deoxygalactonokinase [Colwellia sp.]|jgi:2-dehydro-3-deoxygalactonokinase
MGDVIVIDWGTSHLRAYLCQLSTDDQLQLIDTKFALGVTKSDNNFEAQLFNCIDEWVTKFGKLPIKMAGQIGSSIGWKETSYLTCPVSPDDIANSCLTFSCRGHEISIVPGVSCLLGNDYHDVMRGEELQVLGWLNLQASNQQGKYMLCLPGTHTKWVLVENGKIVLFKTAMTGELFDLLNNQSVLIQTPNNKFNEGAFRKGVKYSLNSELGSFSHSVFSVRSNQLFGKLKQDEASSYLSGFLIASDVRAAINASEWDLSSLKNVIIIGAKQLSHYFSTVLAMHNVPSVIYDDKLTIISGFSKLNQSFLLSKAN